MGSENTLKQHHYTDRVRVCSCVDTTSSVEISKFLAGLDMPSLAELRMWGHNCLDYRHDQIVGCSVEIFTDPDLGLMVTDQQDIESARD